MKSTILTLFLLSLCAFSVYGQINKQHQGLRIGDEIIKQQVEYVDPGEAGANQVWDFSRLKTINEEYKLTYNLPPLLDDSLYIMGDYSFAKKDIAEGELIVATEHNTMYYYRQKEDSLLLLGHENPTVRLQYTGPVLMMTFPAGYGQPSAEKEYLSKGLYSSTVPVGSQGNITLGIDAFGKMILPTGDTLNPVIRVKHIKTFNNENHNTDKILETYSWYTKGYRYPIFETVRNINAADSTEIFRTAFFYPPQEHLYISNDPDNLALLEEMWNMENKNKENNASQKDTLVEVILSHKAYPNPVSTQLTVEYTLKEQSPVQLLLVSTEGNIVRNIQKKQEAGPQQEVIDCSGLMFGSYHLKLIAGQQTISITIIKK